MTTFNDKGAIMKIHSGFLLGSMLILFAAPAWAELQVSMRLLTTEGLGKAAGEVTISENRFGLVLTPDLYGLQPGLHGFHVHQNPSCDAAVKGAKKGAGLAAGGHFDPAGANHHGPPWGDGHLGDLPALFVDKDGRANSPVLAPRLKLQDLKGRALMIHAGGDNYSDQPAKLGGGGARLACGVID
jgi:Cu-Zn family superoxide dismutase